MYDAGTAALQVVPSFKGVQKAIRAEAERWGSTAGRDFALEFNKAVRASIMALPDLKIDADTSPAQKKVDQLRARLAALSDKRVGFDIDAGDALAEMNRIRSELDRLGAESPEIGVQVDAALASRQLSQLESQADRLGHSNPSIDVDADTGHAQAQVAALDNKLGAMEANAALSGSRLLTLVAVGATIGPVIVPAAAAAAAAVLAIGAAAGSAVAGIGVLALGFAGVSDAVKAMGEVQSNAGKDAQKAAEKTRAAQFQVANAVDQVRSAEAGLANARENAAEAAVRSAERVQDAQRSLTNAERDARAARVALTQAYEDAKRAQEDLASSLRQGQLDQRQANLDLIKAKQALDKILTDPHATAIQREQAKITYEQAVARVDDLRVRNARLAADKAKSDKAGVAGSKQVVQATDRVRDANERVGEAQRNLAEAVRAQTTQQRQSAHSIAQAQQGLVSAQRALAKATTDTGVQGSASMDKLREAMDKLSPAGQRFARFLFGLRGRFDQLKATAEAGLLPGVERAIVAVLPHLPKLDRLVHSIAVTMGGLAEQAGKALNSPFWRDFFDYMERTAAPTIRTMAEVVGNLARGFAGMLKAFQPVADKVGDGLLSLSRKFATFGESQVFQDFLAYVQRVGPAVVETVVALVRAIARIVVALAPIGEAVLAGFRLLADTINRIPKNVLTGIAVGIIAIVAATYAMATAMSVLNAAMLLFAANPIGAVLAAIGLVVGAAVAGLVALGAGFVYAWKQSEEFRIQVRRAADVVKIAFGDMWQTVGDILRRFGADSRSSGDTVIRVMSGVVGVVEKVAQAWQVVWYLVIKPTLGFLTDGVLVLWHGVLEPFVGFVEGRLGKSAGAFATTAAVFKGLILSTSGAAELAADRVRNAERNLASALAASEQAMRDLTQARKDAKQALDDLNSRVLNGALAERQAVLNVAAAKKELDRVKADPTADTLQRQQAQLTYDQAVQQLADTRTQNKRTAEEKALADAKGVEGSKQVQGALQGVKDASKKVADAEAELNRRRLQQNEQQKASQNGVIDFIIRSVVPRFWSATRGILAAWEDLKTRTRKPIEWLVKTTMIDGLLLGYNTIAKVFNKNHKATSLPWPPKGWATGGVLPGYTPGRDVHRFFSPSGGAIDLSGGEAVMRPEWTRAVGPDFVKASNAAARAGGVNGVKKFLGGYSRGGVLPGHLGGFEGGGVIDWIRGKAKSAKDWAVGNFAKLMKPLADLIRSVIARTPGEQSPFVSAAKGLPAGLLGQLTSWVTAKDQAAGGQFTGGAFQTGAGGWPPRNANGAMAANTRAAQAFIRSKWPGLSVGTYVSPHAWSDHHWGKALDIMMPRLRHPVGYDIANWFVDNPKAFGTKYLIYAGRYNGGRGWGPYSQPGQGDHSDHVHLSLFDEGGYLKPGLTLAYNGTGKPERVLTAGQEQSMMAGAGTASGGDSHYHLHESRATVAQLEALQTRQRILSRAGRPR